MCSSYCFHTSKFVMRPCLNVTFIRAACPRQHAACKLLVATDRKPDEALYLCQRNTKWPLTLRVPASRSAISDFLISDCWPKWTGTLVTESSKGFPNISCEYYFISWCNHVYSGTYWLKCWKMLRLLLRYGFTKLYSRRLKSKQLYYIYIYIYIYRRRW